MENENIKDDFDFVALQDSVVPPAVRDVFAIFGKHAESLQFTSKSDASIDVDPILDEIAQDIMISVTENKVPEKNMQLLLDEVQTIIQSVFTRFTRHKNELEKELLARVKGAVNPGDGKLSNEYATLNDLFSAVNKFRTEQDVNGSRYFYEKTDATRD